MRQTNRCETPAQPRETINESLITEQQIRKEDYKEKIKETSITINRAGKMRLARLS